MKKTLSILLAVMLMLFLASCGETSVESGMETQTQTAETEVTEMQTAGDTAEAETVEEENVEITFEEMIVIDNEECLVKITDIEEDDIWGCTLKVQLENKSADKVYMFSLGSAAINGVMTEPFFAAEVAAGKKSNEEISFSDYDEELCGEVTDIELTFRVYDSEDWAADDIAEETVHVYPVGEENAVKYVREARETDIILLESEEVTVVVTDFEEDGLYGYTANLFIENNSASEILVSAEDVSVNGYMIDPFFATSVMPGKCEFTAMSWFDADFEDNGISEVEEIELRLHIYDANDWSADDIANEIVVIKP